MRLRSTGLRNRSIRPKREKVLRITLNDEEYAAIFAAAGYTEDFAAVWGRDVLLSRAAALFKQRMLA